MWLHHVHQLIYILPIHQVYFNSSYPQRHSRLYTTSSWFILNVHYIYSIIYPQLIYPNSPQYISICLHVTSSWWYIAGFMTYYSWHCSIFGVRFSWVQYSSIVVHCSIVMVDGRFLSSIWGAIHHRPALDSLQCNTVMKYFYNCNCTVIVTHYVM